MPADVSGVLTRRIGPLPAWAWGGLVAAGAWWFFLRKPAGSTAGTTGAASGSQLSSGYSLGYAQGIQAAGPQPAASPGASPAPVGIPLWQFGQPQGSYVWRWTGQNAPPGVTNTRQVFPGSNSPANHPEAFPGGGGYSWQWAPVPGGMTDAQYAQQLSQAAASGQNIGGPGRIARKHAIGARSAAGLWSDAHPLVGGPVLYPHYVRAVGGPANHRSEVHRVATAAGVHPARVLMLNPRHTGRIRVA